MLPLSGPICDTRPPSVALSTRCISRVYLTRNQEGVDRLDISQYPNLKFRFTVEASISGSGPKVVIKLRLQPAPSPRSPLQIANFSGFEPQSHQLPLRPIAQGNAATVKS